MNDKEKVKRILNMVEYSLENMNKQSEHAWYNDTINDLVTMRKILTSKA